ncbi:aldehyde dehydrogenase [Rhizocola hellebori]|uniref:Aldehyde dehydrogenase n=1 Tax=Rhizocola hellebori TaxID=1392758 RepID=A0A8J3QI98_9ACTN|nr:aldehyde dehydrogenase family protein [Rhizocola hellebori]GIH11388.1 aldehyde dehydrogenase [Rhizocola hellebori]
MIAGEHEFARNLIDGQWVFPRAPYEFEIRNPRDSTVTAVVPLSSRHDVARAVAAADTAAPSWAAQPALRLHLVTQLVSQIETLAEPLASLQACESGLSQADSRKAVLALMGLCRRLLTVPRADAGVSAHVLSWGLPLAEVVCAVLPHLLAGRTAVVKPSLRAPLSAVAFAHLTVGSGWPPGVVNVVQGAGADVAAEMFSTRGLAALQVRANDRTLAMAARSASGARLCALRAGGNMAIAGPDADPERVAAVAVEALAVHSVGGPLSLPLLAVHSSLGEAVTEAVLALLDKCRPAPLPAEGMRRKALAYLASMRAQGARILCGGAVPDDAAHRMGWLLPPTLVALGEPMDGSAGEPVGPVLTIATWRRPQEIVAGLNHPRYADGVACLFGVDPADLPVQLPQPTIVDSAGPLTALGDGALPPSWTGGLRIGPGYDAAR